MSTNLDKLKRLLAELFQLDQADLDLGTLGGQLSMATAVNNRGQVVGLPITSRGEGHVFLWEDGEMIDLAESLPAEIRNRIVAVKSINDAGQLLVETRPDGNDTVPLLLTPPVCQGFTRCDANCDGSIDLQDVEPFILLLLTGEGGCDKCTGDTTGDGSVDLTDVEGFIECLLG